MERNTAVEDFIDLTDENIDLYKAYIRKAEREFAESIDEILESINLSHLRAISA